MKNEEEWTLVNEFGKSKTLIQKSAIKLNGSLARVPVRYSLDPPGTDKRNGKAVAEMIIFEEYNLEKREVQVHGITFLYVGGGTSDLLTKPEWTPATAGYEKTLNFLLSVMNSPVYADVIGGINFPRILNGFELRSVIDNEKSNPGLGVTLLYNAPGIKVSVFVYDHSQKNIPEGIDSSIIHNEFSEAKGNIRQAYPDMQILVREERLLVAGVPILQSAFQYTEMRPGSRETVFSHLYLTARKGNFVKIRATYSAIDQPELGHRIQMQFIKALCGILAK